MIALIAAIGIGMVTFAVAYQAMPYRAPAPVARFLPIKDQSRVPDYIVPRVVQTVKYTRPIAGPVRKAVKKVATKKKVKRWTRYGASPSRQSPEHHHIRAEYSPRFARHRQP